MPENEINAACRLCGSSELIFLIDFGEHPIAHRLLDTQEQEEYVNRVDLIFCPQCGLFQLGHLIPPEELYTTYNWLSAWKWNPHVPRLMEIIEEILPLSKNAKIIEIGSNDGSFLSELQRHGFKHTFGVEPAEDARRASHQKGIRTVGHYFNLHTAEQITAEWGKFDFIVVRQVLEHIEDLNGFQASLQRIVRPGGYILVEVPNFSFGLTAKDYSSIWEEHINYFCQPTLEKYLNDAGFSVIHHECAEFSGEAFIVLAQYDDDTAGSDYENQREWIYRQAKDFKACWPIFKTRFAAHLAQEKSKGARIALFGAGCRACSLINFTELKSYIELVVDDQPQKQGKYMPGSRLPIYDVSALYTYKIDTCLLSVNAENENAVLSKHKRYQEREGKFVSVNPPSRRLLPFWKQIQ